MSDWTKQTENWTKQTENLVQTWADTQKKIWDNWVGAMDSMGGMNLKTMEGERQKAIDTWHKSMQKGYEAQAEWANIWVKNLESNKSTPKPMLDWAKQMQSMMLGWTQSQEQLSGMWFDMIKKIDTGNMTENWEAQSKQLMQSWQEAVDKSMEAQQSMTKAWTEASQSKAKKA